MIKQILINEIKDLIGHNPSREEYQSAYNYLKDQLTAKSGLADVGLLLFDWRHDCMNQCPQCGDYFLNLEEYEIPFSPYCIKLCGEECRNEYVQWERPEQPEISQHI